MPEDSRHIVVIGNGVAGITCARHVRKQSDARITVISGETDYFFSRTALMYVYMGHMQFEHTKPYEEWFWKKNRIELKKAWVTNIESENKQIIFDDHSKMTYDELVIATGSVPNKFGWKGQDLNGVQGLYSYQDLQLLEENTHPPKSTNNRVKRAVIVGGGLIGVELAEMLLTRNIEVIFLVREKHFWGNVLTENEGKLIVDHLRTHHVNLLFETELDEIIGDENNQVKAVKTKDGNVIDCQLVGLTAGVRPNIDWLKQTSIKTNKGVIINTFFETSEPNVYAIGDCAEMEAPPEGVKSINQVWYTGRIMGETLAQTLTGNKTSYLPGPWFNSAKFFEIEYQTYGNIAARPEKNVGSFYWRKGDRALTLQFEKDSMTFLGINSFGMRLRHEHFDRWLKNKISVMSVLEGLPKANFDSEFYRSFEHEIVHQWNEEHPEHIVKIKKRFWVF